MTENNKFCSRCKLAKPHSEFYVNRATSGGLQNYCRSCCSAVNKEYLEKSGRRKEFLERTKAREKKNADELNDIYVARLLRRKGIEPTGAAIFYKRLALLQKRAKRNAAKQR